MDAIEQLKQDLREGRIDAERLLDLFVMQQRQLESTQRQLESTQSQLKAALQRIAEFENKAGAPVTAKVEEPFSVRAEEKRQKNKKNKLSKKGRRGRLSSSDKVKLAEITEPCYPEGVAEKDCKLSHTRPVWRLRQGRAILVAYQIYRGPGDQYGKIPGVLGRCEFGMEIILEIAYFVYIVGLSFDKVCLALKFLQNLPLGKTQADTLLQRLAKHWRNEFEVLCTLLANSLIVHTDETSWSINSAWAFLSEKARVLFFGVHKDADTLKEILDPKSFAGLVISDDAAIYAKFTQAQKCWAHLLRKAIKLTLQDPDEPVYRQFTDRLLEIYYQACRIQRDGRLGAAGRAKKVTALDEEVLTLCAGMWSLDLPPLQEGPENDYRLLVNEVMRLMLAQQLFTFVTAEPASTPNGKSEPVAGTNNESERTLRNPAGARDTGRASKTLYGARRQTIVVSVLESLRLYLPIFTLDKVIAEVQSWADKGQSCFTRLLRKLKLKLPTESTPSVLDKVAPLPDG